MKGNERNKPCPCGSGKKYKNCCGNIIMLPTAASSLDLDESENTTLNGISLDEINMKIAEISRAQNQAPIDDFLGLSAEQMDQTLYSTFELKNQIFDLVFKEDANLSNVRVIKQAIFLMEALHTKGHLKATAIGNLPKAFVIDFFDKFEESCKYYFRPCHEGDLSDCTLVKYLLRYSGLMKTRNKKYSLTQKGEKLFKNLDLKKIYEHLLGAAVKKWNWAQNPYEPELDIIQRSAVFHFYLIHKKAQTWISSAELGGHFLKAFPFAIEETSERENPEEEVISCFVRRFIIDICIPFQLLEHEDEEAPAMFAKSFRVTPFFKDNIKFLL